MAITADTARFVTALNRLHGDERTTFTATAGRTYDRVVITNSGHDSVHAFVQRETGYVLKPAGWSAPARGVRFTTVDAAADSSDRYGSYLYR